MNELAEKMLHKKRQRRDDAQKECSDSDDLGIQTKDKYLSRVICRNEGEALHQHASNTLQHLAHTVCPFTRNSHRKRPDKRKQAGVFRLSPV